MRDDCGRALSRCDECVADAMRATVCSRRTTRRAQVTGDVPSASDDVEVVSVGALTAEQAEDSAVAAVSGRHVSVRSVVSVVQVAPQMFRVTLRTRPIPAPPHQPS